MRAEWHHVRLAVELDAQSPADRPWDGCAGANRYYPTRDTACLSASLYRWRTKSRIYRSYRALLALEQDLMVHYAPEKREELLGRLDDIEKVVNGMKVPAFFAEQFYVLRGHISFVRGRLMNDAQSP